eukprot:2238635-Pyramimonas_sp.AAC.1
MDVVVVVIIRLNIITPLLAVVEIVAVAVLVLVRVVEVDVVVVVIIRRSKTRPPCLGHGVGVSSGRVPHPLSLSPQS